MGKKNNDFWLDDPEWELLRRKTDKHPISNDLKQQVAVQQSKNRPEHDKFKSSAKKLETEKEIVFNLKFALPKVRLDDLKLLVKKYKKQMIYTSSALLLIVILLGGAKLFSIYKANETANKPATPQEEAAQVFNPLVPLENLTDGTGKQSNPDFRYDKDKSVLAYQVEYNTAKLTVSQQALPDQLKTNPGQIEGIARSVKASHPIETQKGKAFIATDEELKTQIAVFATDSVLVFIRSEKILDDEEWKFYINQLTPKE